MLKYIRRRLIPPCSECKWHDYGQAKPWLWVCKCPDLIRHEEKIFSTKVDRVDCCDFRGTRHCKFEPKEVKEVE